VPLDEPPVALVPPVLVVEVPPVPVLPPVALVLEVPPVAFVPPVLVLVWVDAVPLVPPVLDEPPTAVVLAPLLVPPVAVPANVLVPLVLVESEPPLDTGSGTDALFELQAASASTAEMPKTCGRSIVDLIMESPIGTPDANRLSQN
jgi:hypothetical protein